MDLEKVRRVIWKILSELELDSEDFQISCEEKQIVEAFLKKKKYDLPENFEMDGENLKWILRQKLNKKVENELKFVITRSIKFLQKKFKLELLEKKKWGVDKLSTEKRVNSDMNRKFYEAYFGEIAAREQIPIERFFHFQSWKKRKSKDVPKSVTRQSLFMWKKNPHFISQIREYISVGLKKDISNSLENKFKKIIEMWEYFIRFYGEEEGLVEILDWFDLRGRKLPWNKSEIQHAIDTTLKYLS